MERSTLSEKERENLKASLESEVVYLEDEVDRNNSEADQTKKIFKKI